MGFIREIFLTEKHQHAQHITHTSVDFNSSLTANAMKNSFGLWYLEIFLPTWRLKLSRFFYIIEISGLNKILSGSRSNSSSPKVQSLKIFIVIHWHAINQNSPQIYSFVQRFQHIEAETNWLLFFRQHFQMHFLGWKCMNFTEEDFT